MPRPSLHPAVPALLVLFLLAPTARSSAQTPRRVAPPAPSAAQAFARAEALLEDPSAPAGDLPVAVRMAYDPVDPYRVHLEAQVDLGATAAEPPLAGPIRITLLAATLEGDLVSAQKTVEDPGAQSALTGADAWAYRDVLDVSDELHAAVAVVEDLGSGRWGAGSARLATLPWSDRSDSAEPADRTLAVHDALAPPPSPGEEPGRIAAAPTPPTPTAAPDAEPRVPAGLPSDWSLPPRPAPGARPGGSAPAGARVIAVLPPRDRPATGRTRFETLITTGAVERVEFFLDGELAGEDDRPPFNATLDLGPEPRPHTVRAVAYGRGGGVLGEHTLEVNSASATPFAVTITALDAGADGTEVEAAVSLPVDGTLARVEVYRNEELVARLAEPPYRARIPAEPGAEPDPADFVRIVAYLADGTQAEDVRFLSGEVAGERVEVNLVEIFAVVTGEDGEPVEGLGPDDFEIRLGRETMPIERFQRADDVPLTLALAVDTSESMWPLMIDTRQAAARFLVNTLIPDDEALLVAFSNRPRLIAPASGDVQALLRSFASLQAGGATALYDSIVFSLVQLEEASGGGGRSPDRSRGRRAVVLLTDGQDYGSRFRPRRVIGDARAQGTPVYVISMAGLYNERGSVRKPDLEAIAENTGGRTYYIGDASELPGAYAQINRELRTQYILAFGTERPLTERELGSIRLRVKRPGLEVRTAVEPSR